MASEFLHQLLGSDPADPGLNLLRLAAQAARPGGQLDMETLAMMREQVAAGVIADFPPKLAWPVLQAGLMAESPARMIEVLRDCGALEQLLPELEVLFGVPQSADEPAEVDVGEHVLAVLDEAAWVGAPLPVRFAALVYCLGKADSPREHLPSHYRHMDRGRPRLLAVCERFGVDDEVREFALLVLAESERVHRAAEMRAGSIAAMLERVRAFDRTARFERLLLFCSCDFHAYPGRHDRPYPKATLLQIALKACRNLDEAAVLADCDEDDGEVAAQALLEARAAAVAQALRSERWALSPDNGV